jgi:hypothetical protein
MRRLTYAILAILLVPSVLHAGQVYGTVTANRRAIANTPIEIRCGTAVTVGNTSADGSYRINVRQQGQCTLTLSRYSGQPSAIVFSYPKPTQYDFEIVNTNGRYQLRRR